MRSLRTLSRTLCSPAAGASSAPAGGRWERLKSSRAGVWLHSMFSDYRAACKEIVVSAWERPLKTSLYLGILAGGSFCFYTKPDRCSFEATLVETANQLGLLSPWIRSATSDSHVQSVVKLLNQGELRYASLGLLSVMYHSNYDPNTSLYEAQCSSLALPWREIPHRLLDVGFAGRWWILTSRMKDYDVNQDEFKHLPPHMFVTSPPTIKEVERNESLHKQSWLPLSREDEETEPEMVDRQESPVNATKEKHIPA